MDPEFISSLNVTIVLALSMVLDRYTNSSSFDQCSAAQSERYQ